MLVEIKAFMHQGGPVLWWLGGVMVLFWGVAIERIWYLNWIFPKQQHQWLAQWQQRNDRHSWFAQAQRTRWLDEANAQLKLNLSLLKLFLSLFPMLGLLGTVTGMISVFDILAIQKQAELHLMASGISMATLPTMAGMVATLTGMFAYSQIHSVCEKRRLHLEQLMHSKYTDV